MKNDLKGQRFGRLLAIEPVSIQKGSRRRTYWRCRCDCGVEPLVAREVLTRGEAHSCGCLQKESARERRISHGKSGTRLHKIWLGIKDRCGRERNPAFHNYGGRGIKIHEAWEHDFDAFAAHVGEPPTYNHSLDRIDNDGDYAPGNVRWATPKEQRRNSRALHMVNWKGKDMCLLEAAEMEGLSPDLVHQRVIRLGWSLRDALTIQPKVGQKVQR